MMTLTMIDDNTCLAVEQSPAQIRMEKIQEGLGPARYAVNRDEQDTRAIGYKVPERIDGPRLSKDETAVDRGLPRTVRQ